MLARAVVVLCLAACGSAAAPPQEPAAKPAGQIPQVGETPPPEPFSQIEQPSSQSVATLAPIAGAPPDPEPVHEPLLDRLRDGDGKIAGMPGFAIKRMPSKKHCGGFEIVTTRGRRVAKHDEPLAAILDLEFPRALSFDMKRNDKRKASIRKFNAFVDKLTKVAGSTGKHYEAMRSGGGDAAVKVAAAARVAQMHMRLASLFARAPIPIDVRTGELAAEKIDAFCDALRDKAEPIQVLAEQAMADCAAMAKPVAAGWWNEVCVMP
ncbi:MAG TPA: hypothetical protein VIV11_05405 [Kofleriaceae bacterium]